MDALSKSPVKLSVHKNTVAGRAKRDLARHWGRNVEGMIRENDIRCMAFIGIGEDGRAFAMWDTGGVVPLYGFPETIGAVLRIDVECSASHDDYRLPLRGGKFQRESRK